MRRLRRILGWLLLWIVLVAVLGMIGLNGYLNSGGFRDRLNVTLSANLGMSVDFEKASLWPWSGFRVHGLQAGGEDVDGGSGEALVSVGEIRVEPAWTSLASDEIEIRRLVVLDPMVSAVRQADGKIALPVPRAQLTPLVAAEDPRGASDPGSNPTVPGPAAGEPPESGDPAPANPTSQDPEIASATDPGIRPDRRAADAPGESVPPPDSASTSPPPNLPHGIFLHQLNRRLGLAELDLRGGAFQFLAAGIETPLVEIGGYEVALDLRDPDGAEGVFRIDSISALGVDWMQEFESKVHVINGGSLLMDDLSGAVLLGRAEGKVLMNPTLGGLPFQVQFQGTGLSMAELGERMEAAGGQLTPDAGEVDFSLVGSGFAEVPETVRLRLRISGRGIEARELRSLVPAVRVIGGGRTSAMADLFVADFDLDARLLGGRLRFEDLRVQTKYLTMRGGGEILPRAASWISPCGSTRPRRAWDFSGNSRPGCPSPDA